MAVDATSGAGGLRVDPTEFDAYYLAPQKCFASDGGLWIALMSPAALERVEPDRGLGPVGPGFLDLKTAVDNSMLDQTYNTPALATIFLLAEQLDWMLRERRPGVERRAAATARPRSSTPGPSSRTSPRPSSTTRDERSHVVGHHRLRSTPCDAAAVAAVLRANGIVDTEPYRKLGRNQLRIAMFPAIEPDDVASLCACINYVVERLA